jgi:Putative adhesin
MKYILPIALLYAGILLAQDGVQKATVPLDDPARPVRIRARQMMGGITVRGGNVKGVTVEARSRDGEDARERERRPAESRGMKRLNLPGNAGLDISEAENTVDIKTSSFNRPVDLVITAPRRSSLQLKCMNNGDIEVDGIEGDIEADNLNGRVTLKNVSGTVNAHSLNGEVTAILNSVNASKPLSFSTMNGDIDVTLPANPKANVRMKTDHGEIYSDFEVKFEPGARVEESDSQHKDGHYRLRFDRTLRGTINGGGPEYQFTTFNGQIYLRKKK